MNKKKTPNPFFVFTLIFVIVAGCGDTNRKLQTHGIKIGELAPAGWDANAMQFLKTTNIDIITYELPVKDINSFDSVWAIIPDTSVNLRINDPAGYAANGLRVATDTFGKINKITDELKTIKARKLSTTSLLIQSDQPEMLVLGRLTRKSTISYIARGGTDVNTEAGPAILGLQVYARQIKPPTISGQTSSAQTISRVQITPIIANSTEGLPEELAIRLKETDLRIYSAAFGLNMKPGDIFVLAPKPDKIDNQATVANRYFTRNGSRQMIKILLFICTSIT